MKRCDQHLKVTPLWDKWLNVHLHLFNEPRWTITTYFITFLFLFSSRPSIYFFSDSIDRKRQKTFGLFWKIFFLRANYEWKAFGTGVTLRFRSWATLRRKNLWYFFISVKSEWRHKFDRVMFNTDSVLRLNMSYKQV